MHVLYNWKFAVSTWFCLFLIRYLLHVQAKSARAPQDVARDRTMNSKDIQKADADSLPLPPPDDDEDEEPDVAEPEATEKARNEIHILSAQNE